MAVTTVYRVGGPCIVEVNIAGAGFAALGSTQGGVTIAPRSSWQPVNDDDHGEAPASFIQAGKGCTIQCAALNIANILALKAMWRGDLWSIYTGGVSTASKIGAKLSAVQIMLKIKERDFSTDATSYWQADWVTPQDPPEILLSSVKELVIPLTWLIIPAPDTGKLFSHVPGYLE